MVEDEEEGLCEEERALKPLVPAGVTACDDTGAADFWAKSVPKEQKSGKEEKSDIYTHCKTGFEQLASYDARNDKKFNIEAEFVVIPVRKASTLHENWNVFLKRKDV